jgi:hypothetical protein
VAAAAGCGRCEREQGSSGKNQIHSALGAAYLAGFAWASEHHYEAVVEMDADGSHAPEDLPALLSAAEDADLVLGSRYVPGGRLQNWPRRRELLSRWGNRYVRTALGVPLRDATGGYRAFRAEVLRALPLAEIEFDECNLVQAHPIQLLRNCCKVAVLWSRRTPTSFKRFFHKTLMTSMKAIRLHARGGPEQLVFEEARKPSPGAGHALVRGIVHLQERDLLALVGESDWEATRGTHDPRFLDG